MRKNTFKIVTMNMRDGSVQGHAAGCADLKRGKAKFAEPDQANYAETVETKADAFMSYNGDFLAEGGRENCYEIDWLPCASMVPEGDIDALIAAEYGDEAPVEETPAPEYRIRKGRKWTYVFLGDEEVAYVRNDQVAQILLLLKAAQS